MNKTLQTYHRRRVDHPITTVVVAQSEWTALRSIAGTFDMPTSYQWWVWEREAHINWSMVTYQGSTRSELLRGFWPCAGGLSAVNAIGTQLRGPINSGLARWCMAVLNTYMGAAAELGRNPVSKHHFQPEYGNEQADAGRDCRTRFARPNSQARTRTGKK